MANTDVNITLIQRLFTNINSIPITQEPKSSVKYIYKIMHIQATTAIYRRVSTTYFTVLITQVLQVFLLF